LALLGILWLFPIGFTACSKDSYWCSFAYWITESAGKIGTPILIFAMGFFYALNQESNRRKITTFFKSILIVGVLVAALAFFNEHVTKKALKLARPSHIYVVEQSGTHAQLDVFYRLNESERKLFLQRLIDFNKQNFNQIDTRVLNHWIEESGYSFPSGHSFNAFLLAYIMAYSMFHSTKKYVKLFYFIPFVWAVTVAVSRVAIGAHSVLDVSFGAALGLLAGCIFLYVDTGKKLVIPLKDK
jgi:phosphatidylglycerophosphatase B